MDLGSRRGLAVDMGGFEPRCNSEEWTWVVGGCWLSTWVEWVLVKNDQKSTFFKLWRRDTPDLRYSSASVIFVNFWHFWSKINFFLIFA